MKQRRIHLFLKHKTIIFLLSALCVLVVKSVHASQIPRLEYNNQIATSGDGRFIAFASDDSTLVPDDTNGVTDIFVLDRLTSTTSRVSISSTGVQSDADSSEPDISADGRFVAFQSTASNLIRGSENPGYSQIYVHDRLTGITERISVNDRGEAGNAYSNSVSIAADGRYVAFQSQASNLVLADTNDVADVFIRDRLTEHTTRASVGSGGSEVNAPSGEQLAISENSRHVVFTSQGSGGLAIAISDEPRIYVYNRVLASIDYINLPVDGRQRTVQQLATSAAANLTAALTLVDESEYEILVFEPDSGEQETLLSFKATPLTPQMVLSSDGSTLMIMLPQASDKTELLSFDLESGNSHPLEISPDQIAVSTDGTQIAYTQESEALPLILQTEEHQPGFTVGGRVTDSAGHPVSLVTIKTNYGDWVRTDGNGYFFFGGIPRGRLDLFASKDGFDLEPESISLEVESDLEGLHFQAYHDAVLKEARKDLGMPYSFDRGGNGPFHGYRAGYCTDLVLDAYTWGVEYNIQFALEQDYRANPEHVYRWRDARNANDMWRYFAYSGQMLPHTADYQPGDIVFFDWDQDGEIDHVSIISEVEYNNRPKNQYDATGVIDINPSGLAAELPWEAFHEKTVRGHARWSGQYEPVIPQMPMGQYLQVLVGPGHVDLRLSNPQGNTLSHNERGIPGGVFMYLGWEQSLSIFSPLENGDTYTVVLHNSSDSPAAYQFLAQTTQDGRVTERVEFKSFLVPRGTYETTLTLSMDEEGKLSLTMEK